MIVALRKHYKKEGLAQDTIMGLSAPTFMVLFLLSMVIFIVAVLILAKNAQYMPSWAVVVAILALCIPSLGPFVTILLALLVRK